MPKRIIGQCSIVDFRYLEHLSDVIAQGGEIDVSNLTNRQKMAVRVLQRFNECNVSFEVLLKVREVLIWEDEHRGIWFEYKLMDPHDTETRSALRNMYIGDER